MLCVVCVVSMVNAQTWTYAGNDSWTITTGDVTLGVSNLGGKLSLQRAGQTDSVYVAMDRLVEVSATTGADVWKVDLNNVLFGWGTPTLQTVDGVNRVYMSVNATIRNTLPPGPPGNGSTVPHKIFMYVYLYQANGTITFGNDTYTVVKDSAKFSVKITNWEWRGAGNKLRIDFALGVNGVNYQPQPPTTKPGANGTKTCNLNNRGSIDVVDTAITDGTTVDVISATYGAGGRSGVSITFPYFASELNYDPTLTVGSTSSTDSGANAVGPTSFVSFSLLVAVLAAFTKFL